MAYLKVRVTPGARQSGLAGWRDDVLLLRVRAAPERGLANQATCRLLAQQLGLPHSCVRLARGATSRRKLLFIEGLGPEEVRQRLSG